jgi:hypothetical protein
MVVNENFFKKATDSDENIVDIITWIEKDFDSNDIYKPQGNVFFIDDVGLRTNEIFVLNLVALKIFGDDRKWIDLYLSNPLRRPGTHQFGEIVFY